MRRREVERHVGRLRKNTRGNVVRNACRSAEARRRAGAICACGNDKWVIEEETRRSARTLLIEVEDAVRTPKHGFLAKAIGRTYTRAEIVSRHAEHSA